MQHVSEESASQSNETNDLPELSRYRAPTVPNRYMGPSVQHGMPPVYPSAGVLQHPPVAAQVRTHVVRDVLHQLCIPQLPSGFTSKIPIPYLSLIPCIFEIEGILGTGITSTVYSATVHQDVLVQDVNLRHKFTYSYAIPPYVRQSSMRSAPRANILLCDTVPVVALKVYHCDLLPFLTAPIPPRTIDCHTIPPPQCRTFRSHIDDGIRPSHSNLYSRSHDPFAKVGNDRYFRDLFEESQFQHLLNHPNLAKIYASWFELGKHERFEENVEKAHMLVHQRPHHDTTPRIRYSICLAMELCEGISLEEYFEYLMRSTQRTHRVERQANVHEGCQTQSSTAHRVVRLHVVDEPMIRHILGQLIAALYHLHHVQNVIHRDLKPENIMLCGFDPRRIAQSDDADPNTSVNGESAWILKLIDFGCSMRLMYGSEILQDYIGTVPYMSPQVVTTSAYTTKTDMWSLGVILYEMLLGMSPFSEVRTGDDMRSALARWVKPKSLVPLDDSGKAQPLPPDLAEMCLQLLEKEERKRPSAKKLLRRFPWCRAYLQPEDAVGYLDRWL